MATHKIKLQKEFCDAVLSGEKNFEVRFNDRAYQKGDNIRFIPVDTMNDDCGTVLIRHDVSYKIYEITYVLSGWGLQEGYVVFGIKEVGTVFEL